MFREAGELSFVQDPSGLPAPHPTGSWGLPGKEHLSLELLLMKEFPFLYSSGVDWRGDSAHKVSSPVPSSHVV